MTTRLLFIRHGELNGDSSSVLHASNDPVTLSAVGRETMSRVSSAIGPIHGVFSSNETRTAESADIIAREAGVPVIRDPRLQGRSWGDFAGREWKEVGRLLEGKSLEERYKFVPPNGESWKAFEGRILSALDSIVRNFSGKTVCIVSHGSSIRVILSKVFGVSIEESLKLYPDYGSVSEAEHDGQVYKGKVFNAKV